MNKEIKYWKWKNTIIDFNTISDDNIDCNDHIKKKDYVFRYLGIPDNNIHEWYNGGYSCEYNSALEYAKELGLVEDYIDYEEKINNLKDKYNKALKLLTEYNLPCEIDKFNTRDENLEYCSLNCSMSEDTYLKCWDRFIEQELEKSDK